MKHARLFFSVLLLLVAGTGFCLAQKFDGFDEVKKMENLAKERGSRDAANDAEKKIYLIEVYGFRPEKPSPVEVYLLEKYQVGTRVVAGIDAPPDLIAHAKGYNATMKELLNKLHKKDIFAEAELATK